MRTPHVSYRVIAALAALTVGASGSAVADTRGLTVQVRERPSADAPVAETVELYSASYALVIGIDAYSGGWPRLKSAISDAHSVAAALEQRGFEITLRTDLDAAALESSLKEFFVIKGADPDARLFVWYAGHGYSVGGEGFIVPADAPRPEDGRARFKLSAMPLRQISQYVRLADAKHVYAVFDACFAGTIFDSRRGLPTPAITRATLEPVRQFLTSGDADQEVSDDGTFRKLFLGALAGVEPADLNRDNYLTASELGLFLSDRVTNLTIGRQTPRYGKLRDPVFDRGDFVFELSSESTPAQVRATPQSRSDTAGVEITFWQSIRDSSEPADFQAYLDAYPVGRFAELARNRIAALTGPSVTERSSAVAPPAEMAAPPRVIPGLEPLDTVLETRALAVLRAQPTTRSETVGRVGIGSQLRVTGKVEGEGESWYRVRLADGTAAYVLAAFLSAVSAD